MRQDVLTELDAIEPFDSVEASHKHHAARWVRSGAPLYRIRKPDVPSQHLVSYFVVFDAAKQMVLLIDHLKAKAWLPTGGHVLVDEHPRDAVLREADEELRITANFVPFIGDRPFFVTVTQTKGPGTHTDISLWYVIEGNVDHRYDYDQSEFSYYQWVDFERILTMDPSGLDPHMHRFVHKLQAALALHSAVPF
jgi:8-oxo-dGTP pyrophosphatase MutT (NUDIX family)